MREESRIVSDFAALAIGALFLVGLIVLAVRLKEVQLDGAADYTYEGARQSVIAVKTAGERGRILDRNGVVLAESLRMSVIVVDPAEFRRRTFEATAVAISNAVARLTPIVNRPSTLTWTNIVLHVNRDRTRPLEAWSALSEAEIARFCEHSDEFPGFSCVERDFRRYPFGTLAAHVIGFAGSSRAEGESGDEGMMYREKDIRGRSGLEAYYDGYLRGVSGEKKVLVDATRYAIREWTVVEPQKGPDLRLTLDHRLQRTVERQLTGERGACVVIDPRDGSVLAMASAPAFNPNFARFSEYYAAYRDDPAKPFLNRASGGQYAPGSTFKPITALAALGNGWAADKEYECVGSFELRGSKPIHCTRRWGHGDMDIRHALKDSCNPFFCEVGSTIGTNAIISAARAFGLGSRSGIDLGNDTFGVQDVFGVQDASGVVPDGEWKQRVRHQRWYPGDLPQMSIGQGMLLTTPLQMARVAGAIGTGFLVTPRLKSESLVERAPLAFPEEHLQVVREGMEMVVNGGTGSRGGEGVAVKVAGKTGTAEVGSKEHRRKNTWFIAYAPADNPVVALAIVIEDGESGGATAAPKAAAILKEVFGAR